MKIGDLGSQFNVPVETIRYYEKENLLPPPLRTSSNYRDYGPAHVDRLRFIVNCRALDMTLDEIRQLLHFHDHPSDNCSDVEQLLDEHIGHVSQRIEELQLLDGQLRRLRKACGKDHAKGSCGILRSLSESDTPRRSAGHVHAKHRGS